MIAGDYRFLMQRQEPLAKWLYTFLSVRCYRPKCIVEYDRFAYITEHNDTRICGPASRHLIFSVKMRLCIRLNRRNG